MKILFISMHSVHASRWIENLVGTEHELYWYDILDRGKFINLDNSVIQFFGMRKRKVPYIKGEYFLSKKTPKLYKLILPFLQATPNEELDRIIHEVNPDIIHSFEMQSCSYPILKTMNKFKSIKWIYSCWGSDIYYYKDLKNHKNKIYNILKRVDVLHTDCIRDYNLACELGFKGEHAGVIPGGSGYHLENFQKEQTLYTDRKIILVKGYEHKFGRALNIIKALEEIEQSLNEHKICIIVFGGHQKVRDYINNNNLNFTVYGRSELTNVEILNLMGRAKIYIGNSISDGMPNTLLEAIIMGAFPIQSNPGGVTSEIITDYQNGICIDAPEDIIEIKNKILWAINNSDILSNANILNQEIAKKHLDYKVNKIRIQSIYK